MEDGHTSEFSSLEELKRVQADLDSDPQIAEKILIGWFLARQPEAANTALISGKSMIFDLSAAQPIRVQ